MLLGAEESTNSIGTAGRGVEVRLSVRCVQRLPVKSLTTEFWNSASHPDQRSLPDPAELNMNIGE